MAGAQSLKIVPPLCSAEADFDDVHDDAAFEERLMEIVRGKYEDVRQQVIAAEGISNCGGILIP